jgi:hypothetical protein
MVGHGIIVDCAWNVDDLTVQCDGRVDVVVRVVYSVAAVTTVVLALVENRDEIRNKLRLGYAEPKYIKSRLSPCNAHYKRARCWLLLVNLDELTILCRYGMFGFCGHNSIFCYLATTIYYRIQELCCRCHSYWSQTLPFITSIMVLLVYMRVVSINMIFNLKCLDVWHKRLKYLKILNIKKQLLPVLFPAYFCLFA